MISRQELRRRVERLLEKPWLAAKLKQPNGGSWLVIEYWRTYEGVYVIVPSPGYNPTNPLIILETLEEVKRIG